MRRLPLIATILFALTACGHAAVPAPARGPAPAAAHASAAAAAATTDATAASDPAAASDATTTPPPLTPAPPIALAPRHGVTPEAELHAAILRRLSFLPPTPCTEQDLPAGARTTRRPAADDSAAADNLGRGIAFGVPHGTVTAGQAGGRDAAVYLSYELDPSSELGDAGYRVRVHDPARGTTLDVALGFAMMRPYVVFHDPLLPLLDGDTVQLAADVREVDDATITYPPVALKAKREAKGRMVRCPLAELVHDTDHDGMTDVEEARLATDPGDADTDGDGLPDAHDPAPLGAAGAKTPEETLWVQLMRDIVAPKVKDQLVLVEVTGPRLSLKKLPMRVLELTHDEIETYTRVFGRHVVATIKLDMSGTYRAKVSLSLGWTGAWIDAFVDGAGGWTFNKETWWVT
jgi:hypothetical protein